VALDLKRREPENRFYGRLVYTTKHGRDTIAKDSEEKKFERKDLTWKQRGL
jgi:hypothetical protein